MEVLQPQIPNAHVILKSKLKRIYSHCRPTTTRTIIVKCCRARHALLKRAINL